MIEYSAVVTLNSICPNWNFYYDDCCRTGAVSNLANFGTTIWVEAYLRGGNQNNSAIMTPIPNTYWCIGDTIGIDFSAVDPDGDSLAYSVISTAGASGVSNANSPGYTPTQPFNALGSFSFDSLTGQGWFVAAASQFSAYAAEVKEYRNGVLVGRSVRDFTIIVGNCTGGMVCLNSNRIQGHVWNDTNGNCVQDPGETNRGGALIRVQPGNRFTYTNPVGDYSMLTPTGNYLVTMVPPNYLFPVNCPVSGNYPVNFPTVGDTAFNNDFGVTSTVLCPYMETSITTGRMRPCIPFTSYIRVCNNGTTTAAPATVVITTDTLLNLNSHTGSLTSTVGGVYTFALGSLAPGACANFSMTWQLPCDTALVGQEFCIEAHAYPDSICMPPNPLWDNSHVTVTGWCINDSAACFKIKNTGTGNMLAPSTYRLLQTNQVILTATFQINAGDSVVFCFLGNGNTLRFEADQRPGHPGNSHPYAEVVHCGSPDKNPSVAGNLPTDDIDHWIDIDCRIVGLSFDPNQKSAYPRGTNDNFHYITDNDQIEYHLDFQNTGTDTAFLVVLRDTLDAALNPVSVRPGAASHPYTFSILNGGVLEFRFAQIYLPDSAHNEPESHGFVEFNVNQNPGNPNGTRIENFAGIYFDINSPVYTNTVFHTIGEAVITKTSNPIFQNGIQATLFPNPTTGLVNLKLEGLESGAEMEIEWMDAMGRTVSSESWIHQSETKEFKFTSFGKGVFFYRIYSEGKIAGTGKLVVMD